MEVPAFLLRRLYVKGSLRNVDGAFAFDLKNALGAGYAEEMLPLSIDGDEIPMQHATFTVDGATVPFEAVGPQTPFTLAMDRVVTIAVDGRTLAIGKHRIGVGFVVTGLGRMRFEVTDAIGVEDGDALPA